MAIREDGQFVSSAETKETPSPEEIVNEKIKSLDEETGLSEDIEKAMEESSGFASDLMENAKADVKKDAAEPTASGADSAKKLHAINRQSAKRFRNKRGSIRIQDEEPERKLNAFNKAGAELLNSRTKNQPVTVRVDGIAPLEVKGHDANGNEITRSIMMPSCMYHGWQIIIPPSEFFAPFMLSQKEQLDDNELLKRMIGYRGAEIDIIPIEFQPRKHMVLASRVKAMEAKRQQMWFATNVRNGKEDYLIHEGSRVEARVTGVIRGALFIEIFGAETGIRAEDVTYQRLKNLRDEFKPGDKFYVIVKNIQRDEELGDVVFEASLREAYPDPRRVAFNQYQVNGIYGGTVSFIQFDPEKAKNSGAFVQLNGIDCFCLYPENRNPDIGDEVTIVIRGKDPQTMKIWGRIMHIEPKRNENPYAY